MQKNNNEKKHSFRDFKAELKKVIWPTPKQLINNTIAVVSIVLVTGVIVFALDFAFENANKFTVNKLKQAVESRKIEEGDTKPQESVTAEVVNQEQQNENEQENKSNVNE